MLHLLSYTLFPVVTIFLGAVMTLLTRPKGVFIHVIQALAGGVLLAGIATELLPRLSFAEHGASLIVAFVLGLVLMLALNQLNPGCCSGKRGGSFAAFVLAFALEFFLNGILIVLAGVVSTLAGFLTGVSMAACCFVCGISVAVRFREKAFSSVASLSFMFLLALLPLVGGLLCLLLFRDASTIVTDDIIAFGMSVLLYIATTDLIVGAFKSESAWVKVSFFLGFIMIPVIAAAL
jgi:zinc transporter ZupT